jgi:hypothetical protein
VLSFEDQNKSNSQTCFWNTAQTLRDFKCNVTSSEHVSFEVFTAVLLRILLHWDVVLCQWNIGSRCFKITYCPHLQESKCERRMWETFGCMSMHTEIVLPVIADWTGCLETLSSDYLFMECNVSEEQDTPVHNTFEFNSSVKGLINLC